MFLATKVEECPCRLLDLFRAIDRVLLRRCSPPSESEPPYPSLFIHSPLFQRWRAVLASLELTVLAALGYSLYVTHPHRALPHLLNLLVPPSHPLLPSLLASSIALLNAFHYLPLPIQYSPITLALSSIAISLHRHRLSPLPPSWIALLGGEEAQVVGAAKEMAAVMEAEGEERLGRVYVAVGVPGEDEIDERRREGEELWAAVRLREAKERSEREERHLMDVVHRMAVEESLKSMRTA